MIDLEKERDLFDEWYANSYRETTHVLPNGQYSSLRKQHSWDAWTSSANREGYKLVKECDLQKTDQEIDQLIDERDKYQENAEELKDKLQSLYGLDFGDHSNANCPFQNAIAYDDGGYKLVPVEVNEDMLNEGCRAISYGSTNEKNCERIYKAMIGVSE